VRSTARQKKNQAFGGSSVPSQGERRFLTSSHRHRTASHRDRTAKDEHKVNGHCFRSATRLTSTLDPGSASTAPTPLQASCRGPNRRLSLVDRSSTAFNASWQGDEAHHSRRKRAARAHVAGYRNDRRVQHGREVDPRDLGSAGVREQRDRVAPVRRLIGGQRLGVEAVREAAPDCTRHPVTDSRNRPATGRRGKREGREGIASEFTGNDGSVGSLRHRGAARSGGRNEPVSDKRRPRVRRRGAFFVITCSCQLPIKTCKFLNTMMPIPRAGLKTSWLTASTATPFMFAVAPVMIAPIQ
jgi:hypothetical protein